MIQFSHRVLVKVWVGSFFSIWQRIDLFPPGLRAHLSTCKGLRFSVTIALILSLRLIGHPFWRLSMTESGWPSGLQEVFKSRRGEVIISSPFFSADDLFRFPHSRWESGACFHALVSHWDDNSHFRQSAQGVNSLLPIKSRITSSIFWLDGVYTRMQGFPWWKFLPVSHVSGRRD